MKKKRVGRLVVGCWLNYGTHCPFCGSYDSELKTGSDLTLDMTIKIDKYTYIF